LYVKV